MLKPSKVNSRQCMTTLNVVLAITVLVTRVYTNFDHALDK